MPRVSEIEEDGGDPTLKAIFDRQREMFGGLLNPTKVMAHCPPILRAAGITLGQTYPHPIVEHGFARARALEALKATKVEGGEV